MADKVLLSVSGMTCSSCAQGISRKLESKGLQQVLVDYNSGEVEFELIEGVDVDQVVSDINKLGYKAVLFQEDAGDNSKKYNWSSTEIRFAICAFFTLPLLAHMFLPFHILHQALFQFIMALPVLFIGLSHFGKSAIGSIKSGHLNMDVLISLGSTSAFLYSTIGWFMFKNDPSLPNYLYFETAATIITLVLLGNIIEKRSLKKTQASLTYLTKMQPLKARKIEHALTDQETVLELLAQHLKPNDLILVNTGDKIPADGLIYEGKIEVDESMMTGESLPVGKAVNDQVLSGTMVLNGYVKVIVQGAGNDTVLSKMIEVVKNSALRKPEIQRLGDKVSAWFVPIVILFAVITFLVSHFYADLSYAQSMLRSISVLVISCPCAMGLATPTAVAVGIGRSARSGVLIKGGDTLEKLSAIKYIIFDKTGTLTQGKVSIKKVNYYSNEKEKIQYLIGYLEKYSNHPFAKIIAETFSNTPAYPIHFSEIKEIAGFGVVATDKEGNVYKIGSEKFADVPLPKEGHQVYVTINDVLVSTIDFEDPIRDDAKAMVAFFKTRGIKTILLSGDRREICEEIGKSLEIDEIYATQLPQMKVEMVEKYQQLGKTAMVGDGINDAPALAVSGVGIAVNSGAQIALQTSDIILLSKNELNGLALAYSISGETMKTIKQNLFWALAYNVIAIPLAAFGFLSPMLASLSMAFSDVVVIGNSLRIHLKKLPVFK